MFAGDASATVLQQFLIQVTKSKKRSSAGSHAIADHYTLG